VVVLLGIVACGRIGFQVGDGTSSAIGFVQEKSPGDGQNTGITIQLSQTAGDLLVVGGYWNADANTVGVHDDTGLTWQALPHQSVVGCGFQNSDTDAGLWYAFATTTQTNVVHLTQTPGTQPIGFFVVEYAGVDPAAPLVAQGGANANAASNSMSAGTLTLARDGVVVGLFNDTKGHGTMLPGAGFTGLDIDYGFYRSSSTRWSGLAATT
jgi:hypothetical protein